VLRQRLTLLVLLLALFAAPLSAQLPFYTDDPAVTKRGTFHFEFFNEFDALHHGQYPSLRQNTTNFKLNYGLPYNLEVDLDSPYLSIFRALGSVPQTSAGIGDTNLGMKWNFRKEADASRVPAMGVTFYVEFPTGDKYQQLGSGESDYWFNFIAQKHLSGKNRLTVNAGIVFAGDTSTGDLGIHSVRGRVYAGGLSLLRDFNAKWTLGAELYGGFTNSPGLSRSQFQILAGGMYEVRKGLTLDFGLLGGKFVASPRIGAQLGFSVDIPAVFRRSEPH
jgi:hypothetical protein